MTNVTTGNIMTAGGLPELVSRESIRAFNENFYLMKYGKGKVLPSGFNTFQFTLFDSMSGSVAALTEGVTPTEVAVNLTGVDVSLTQYGAYATITDVALSDTPIDVVSEAAYELGVDLARKVDVAYQDAIDASTTHVLYGTAGDATTNRTNVDAGDIFEVELIFDGARILKKNSAPRFGNDYICLMHPDVAYDLMTATGSNDWVSVNSYSNTTMIYDGELGKIGGVRIIETPSIQIYANASNGAGSTGTVDVYPTYIFGRDAFGHVVSGGLESYVKSLGSGGSADPLNQRMTIGVKTRVGFALLREAALVRVETSAAKGTNS